MLIMNAEEYIDIAIRRGERLGLNSLAPLERKVFLISEAEVLCDMEGIDSLINRYGINELEECAEAFQSVGANEIATKLKASIRPESLSDGLLNELGSLISSRAGYSYESILQYVKERI